MSEHLIIFADVIDGLRTLEAESVDCCFTSPPYWGLRSYSDDPRELGYFPACACDAGHVPGTVLDPFLGSGTTGVVALREKRRFVGIELAPKYIAMARRRMDALTTRDLGRPVHPEVREATTPEEVKHGQIALELTLDASGG